MLWKTISLLLLAIMVTVSTVPCTVDAESHPMAAEQEEEEETSIWTTVFIVVVVIILVIAVVGAIATRNFFFIFELMCMLLPSIGDD